MKLAGIYLSAGTLCLLPLGVNAQITPDGSTSTTVNTDGNVSTIEAGDRAGSNLFHSFEAFSVPNGNTAFFNNTTEIENIFSRVTGGNISAIDGLIRANNANLFLINPAGVIFGNGARLDIGGSFYGGTADSILFPDAVEFNANETSTPILTINAPIGLNFRDNPADVAIQGSGVEVIGEQNFNLLGGNISLDTGGIDASGGRVGLGAVSAAGTVSLDENLRLDFSNVALADISLNNGAEIDVSGADGGEIEVNARNLTLSESIFNAGISANNSTIASQAGDITINATETVALESQSIIRNNVNTDRSGNAGNILIRAKNLSIADNSRLSSISQGNGNAGNLTLDIAENIDLDRTGGIRSQILPNAIGNGGDIKIETTSLNLTAESSIFTNLAGEGEAGNITITASDRIVLENSNFQTSVLPEGVGNAGNIDITTGSLALRRGALDDRSQILANTRGQGDAGNITIAAQTDISLEDSSFFLASVAPGGEGSGGNIAITTTNLSLTGEAQDIRANLLTDSRGIGDAGDIVINALGTIVLNEYGQIVSQVSEGRGNAGNITINSDGLFLNTGSYIISNTGDPIPPLLNNIGDAGNIAINSRIISLDNFSEITSNSLSNADGRAGNVSVNTDTLTIAGGSNINSLTENNFDGGSIDINAQNIDLITGGKIVTATNSSGKAGNINLNISDSITIDGNNTPIPTEELRFREVTLQKLEPDTGLFANTTDVSSGNGGNINITTPQTISIFNGGKIAVDSEGTGSGGNLFISAGDLDLNSKSQLIAATREGQAAQQPSNIELTLENTLSLQGDSKISARASNNANGGNVTIDAEFVIAFPGEIEGNDIIASADEGSGGRIEISAQEIFGLEEGEAESENKTNDLDVTSELGIDGSVTINTPDINTKTGIRDLPVNAIAPEETVQQTCSATNVTGVSSLSLQGKGGIPAEPTDVMTSDNILAADRFSQSDRTNSKPDSLVGSTTSSTNSDYPPIITAYGAIYPARGLIVTDTGEIILTRSANQRTSKSPNATSNCLAN
ncbi:MAG: filamentous hemagglutinin N-terminal domain-containing protein [Pleurocapsa sp. MO_226.B13]|nr:filamentous hemagglutinin N-terminal domain-containing protein [Pleurocapsa sp. MO_226.B13]